MRGLLLLLLIAVGLPSAAGEMEAAENQESFRQVQPGKDLSVPTPTITYGPQRSAEPDRLAVRVLSVEPEKGVISAFEPFIVEIAITNVSTDSIEVYMSQDLSERIEILDSSGKVVGESPVYTYGEVMYGVLRLGPGSGARSYFVPSAVYQFSSPGSYSVRIRLLDDHPGKMVSKPSDLGPAWAEVTVPVTVLPFDAERLRKRCDELIEPRLRRPSLLTDFPPRQNMMALWSVRHNEALPALKFVAENWGDTSYAWQTAVAIKRIGTSKSEELFEDIASRSNRGRSARMQKPTDLSVHSSGYRTEWTSPRPPPKNTPALPGIGSLGQQ